MALKGWHRVGLVASGMALALAWVLPSRPLPDVSDVRNMLSVEAILGFVRFGWRPQVLHEYTLSGTLADLRARVLVARMADSLFALTHGSRAVRSPDGAITVLYEAPLTADSARAWLTMLERELALAPRDADAGTPLIVALRTANADIEPAGRSVRFKDQIVAENPQSWLIMRFVSPRPERPACFIAMRLAGENAAQSDATVQDRQTGETRTAIMDRCLLYARFGVPGSSVERWAGRRLDVRRYYYPGDDFAAALAIARAGIKQRDPTDGFPDASRREYWGNPLHTACLRGAGELCAAAVALGDDPRLRSDDYWMASTRRAFVASLVVQDPVRFGRFWRSSATPAAALGQAFGRPAGEVVARWWQARVLLPSALARSPARALLSSLGWAFVCTGIGLLIAHRRQVS